jgi:hypothetical protein
MSQAPPASPLKPPPPNPSSLAERLSATHDREREAYARLEAELMTPEVARAVGSAVGSAARDRDPLGARRPDGYDAAYSDSGGDEELESLLAEGGDLLAEYASGAGDDDGSRADAGGTARGGSFHGADTKASDHPAGETIHGDAAADQYMYDATEAKAHDDVLDDVLAADRSDLTLTPSGRSSGSMPRYLMQTQTSINRERTMAENNLRIVRRQQQRSEKARTELVLRKSKLDSELSRTQKNLRESRAKQQLVRSENQALRAQIVALERDAEQLRGAMVHQANVNRNAQSSAKRRLATAEERLKAAEQRADSVSVRNDTLLEANRQQADLAQQVAKLEDDKNKLMAALAKARRRLTDERTGNSEMTRLRYDLELAKAEGERHPHPHTHP